MYQGVKRTHILFFIFVSTLLFTQVFGRSKLHSVLFKTTNQINPTNQTNIKDMNIPHYPFDPLYPYNPTWGDWSNPPNATIGYYGIFILILSSIIGVAYLIACCTHIVRGRQRENAAAIRL